MTLDLDDLERKVQAMTAGPWEGDIPTNGSKAYVHREGQGVLYAHMDAADAAGIVALRNAATELIAAARQGEARAQVTTLRTVVGEAFVACSEGRHGTARFLMQRALDSLDRLVAQTYDAATDDRTEAGE